MPPCLKVGFLTGAFAKPINCFDTFLSIIIEVNKHLLESPEMREERLQENTKFKATKHMLKSNKTAPL